MEELRSSPMVPMGQTMSLFRPAALQPVHRRQCFRRRIVATLAVAVVLAVAVRLFGSGSLTGLLTEAATALRDARPEAVAAGIGFSLLAVLNRGRLHQHAHRCVALPTRMSPMVTVSAAAYALNKVAKTAGAGSVALFIRHGNRCGRSSGSVVAAYMVASISAQLGLGIVVAGAFLTALHAGSLGSVWMATAAGFGIWMAITVIVVAVVLRSRQRLHRVVGIGAGILRWVARKFQRAGPSGEAAIVDDFFDGVCVVRQHPAVFLSALFFGTADKLIGALVLGSALAAAGATVSFSLVLQAFAVALVAANVAVLPAGIGAVEASMVALLSQRGVDLPVATAAVVIFRLLDLWVPLIVGSIAARSLVGRSLTGEDETAAAGFPEGPKPMVPLAPPVDSLFGPTLPIRVEELAVPAPDSPSALEPEPGFETVTAPALGSPSLSTTRSPAGLPPTQGE